MYKSMPIALRPFAPLIALACLALVAPGCAFNKPKRFIVSDSSLNWVEITHLGTNQPGAMVRFSLIGSGSLQLRRGSSPRVLDDFASNTAHPNWDDFRQEEFTLPAGEMRQIFQALVNRGIFDEEPPANRGAPVLPMAKISGRLNGDRFFRHTTEPELLEIVDRLLVLVDQISRPPPLESR